MQAALHLIYPPQCILCDCLVISDFGLCPSCWRQTPILIGLVCDLCGTPLPGEDPGYGVQCDECLSHPRPWVQGRAAMLYQDGARDLVLRLKHSDRMDLARPAVTFLQRAAWPLLRPNMIVAPIPLHWHRFFWRKYNQSALLSGRLAKAVDLPHLPDLLQRVRSTPSQEGRDRAGRYANLEGAFRLRARWAAQMQDKHVLLVDDVMTSGATFSAATQVCLAAGAKAVSVLALCRVAKES